MRAAHGFMARARADAGLRARIAALGADPDIEALVPVAREAGFALTAAELRAAYRARSALAWLVLDRAGADGGV